MCKHPPVFLGLGSHTSKPLETFPPGTLWYLKVLSKRKLCQHLARACS